MFKGSLIRVYFSFFSSQSYLKRTTRDRTNLFTYTRVRFNMANLISELLDGTKTFVCYNRVLIIIEFVTTEFDTVLAPVPLLVLMNGRTLSSPIWHGNTGNTDVDASFVVQIIHC